MTLADFREIVFIDFEFRAASGERPTPVCFVAIEYRSGRVFRQWLNCKAAIAPPFTSGPDVLSVAYFASAEWSCYLALRWPLPANILDLYAEFRNLTNGLTVPGGRGLLAALQWFGLDAIEGAKKDFMRERVLKGDPYSAEDRRAILNYCESDVHALRDLMPKMIAGNMDLRPALLRGRYTQAVAHAEHVGVPVDALLYRDLAGAWGHLQERLIGHVNKAIPVFEGRTFKAARFTEWVKREKLVWPLLSSRALALDEDTFREMAARHPVVESLRQVRQMLGQFRKPDLAVGSDGRNRTLLSPFGTKTGRNTPSNSRFIFGLPSWMRGLIRPSPGRALAYVDWSQQEFGIAAALSGDTEMQRAYVSDDPYLTFAKLAGAVPNYATKDTHPIERRLYKTTILGVQYGIGVIGLAYRLGVSLTEAETLLNHHRRIFRRFWAWSDAACDWGQLSGKLQCVFGWTFHINHSASIRTIRNYPVQGNGAEMLRLGCILVMEAGITLNAPVHDALLVEADEANINEVVAQTQAAMRKASEAVLEGFALRSDAQVIRYPDRFQDERGTNMWTWLMDARHQTSSPGCS
jgi:hypothetical protein